MRPIVDLDQFFHRDLGVDLGGGEAGVAEEFLDVAEVGTASQQVRSERMSKRVRRDVVNVGASSNVFVDHAANGAGGYAAAAAMQEYRLFITLRGRAFVEENRPRLMKVIHQGLKSGFAKRHDPLFFSLAGNTNELLAKVDVL